MPTPTWTTLCCGVALALAGGAQAAGPDAPARSTEHVILISVDGLRPDAIDLFGAETLQRLIREGSSSLEATTILPSKTLPSHTSMLTGADPETHGVTWNTEEMEEHGHIATPTIFAAANDAGLHTAGFFSKRKFQHLMVPGTLDHAEAPHAWPGLWRGKRTVGAAERYLRRASPDLLFVHIGEPDYAGHTAGWMTPRYERAVHKADARIAELLETADRTLGAGTYTVIVTADHGGHGRGHGSDDPQDVTIPWLAWGAGVIPNQTLGPGIRTMDSAATALWLLGVPAQADSVGRPVAEAFQPADVVRATR